MAQKMTDILNQEVEAHSINSSDNSSSSHLVDPPLANKIRSANNEKPATLNAANSLHYQGNKRSSAKILPPVTTPHMVGNELNPKSSMAQKMNDSFHQEVKAQSRNSIDNTPSSHLVGPPLPNKIRSANIEKTATLSAANSLLCLGNAGGANPIVTLENLLEHQWAQGNEFLMEQAANFDIATLLSTLQKLKQENTQLEEKVAALTQRRDNLRVVNARLQIPITFPTPEEAQTPAQEAPFAQAAPLRPPLPRMENGITHGADTHAYVQAIHGRPQPQQNQALRPPMAGVIPNPQVRRPVVSSYQSYPPQQMSSPSLGSRREDLH